MQVEKSVAGTWNRWIRDNPQLVRYSLANSYPPPLSVADAFSICGDSTDEISAWGNAPLLIDGSFDPTDTAIELSHLYNGATESNITFTHGAIAANDIVIRALYEPGDNCVCIAPAYQQLISSPKAHRYQYRELLLKFNDCFKLNFDDLRNLVDKNTKLIVLGNPNNPAGVVYTEKELNTIVDIADSVGAYVLCDEIYRQFEYDIGIPSIFGLYDRAIATSSLSKAFGYPGLRIGWIMANQELTSIFRKLRDLSGGSVGSLDLAVAKHVFKNANNLVDRYLEGMAEKRNLVDHWINHNKHMTYVRPAAGPVAIARYDFQIPSTDLCRRALLEYGVNLLPGNSFGIDDGFRLGFTCDIEELKEGLRKLDDYFCRLEAEQATLTEGEK